MPVRPAIVFAIALSITVVLNGGEGFAQATSGSDPKPSVPPSRPVVAVLPFAAGGASDPEISAGTDRLHEELQRIGVFTVADQGPVNAAYQDQKTQPGACAAVDCAVGIAGALHAQHVITGKMTRIDETHWLVAAQLVDVETTKTLRVSSLQYTGSFFDFVRQAMPFLAARMSGTAPKESRALALRLSETLNLSGDTAVEGALANPPDNVPAGNRRKGFGLSTGYSYSAGTLHLKSGGSAGYAISGIPNLGVDYQADINPQWTLVPYFIIGTGFVKGDVAAYYNAGGSDEFGVEFRYWRDRSYAGVRAALYTVVFIDDKSTKNDALGLTGESLGISGGYEADTGAFINGAYDYGAFTSSSSKIVSARKSTAAPPVKLQGSGEGYTLWLNMGYRWK